MEQIQKERLFNPPLKTRFKVTFIFCAYANINITPQLPALFISIHTTT